MKHERRSPSAARRVRAALAIGVFATYAACGGNPVAPSQHWTLKVLVTDDAAHPVANAQVKVTDGPNAGRTATSDATGQATLASLTASSFTILVTGPTGSGLDPATAPVSLTADASVTVKLPPARGTNPPRITAITAPTRAEVNDQVTVTATVEDDDVPVDQLQYAWSATAGPVTGSGATVTWQAPPSGAPVDCTLTLTVTKKLTVTLADGTTETRQTTASATTDVHVNDSYREVKDVSVQFLDDFANYSVSPETCVRNFSDSCAGKAAELCDIQTNRICYQIESGTFSPSSITFNTDKTFANISGACTFHSVIKACQLPTCHDPDPNLPQHNANAGKTEIASGTCSLTATYENWNWRLCDSHFEGSLTNGSLRFMR